LENFIIIRKIFIKYLKYYILQKIEKNKKKKTMSNHVKKEKRDLLQVR